MPSPPATGVAMLPLLEKDVPVLQRAVRRCAGATAVTAPESASLERIDEALQALQAGHLTVTGEPDAGRLMLPEVFRFFTAGPTEHITDPRTGHDKGFCHRNTTFTYAQPNSTSLCSSCCIGVVRYLLLGR
jgi:hypothetical protein